MTIIPILRSALLAAALISLVAGKLAHAGDADTRAVCEAKTLFRIVTTSILQSKSEACSISSAWLDHPVPEKIAHSQFGLTVHADLAPPFQTVTPVDVLV
jgi:hypothetical protein